MRNVMVSYTLKENERVEDLERIVARFVERIRVTSGIRYSSYQVQESPRSFVHVGDFDSEDELKGLQAQPFFGEFAQALKPMCEEGPSVTWLRRVASTND